MFCPNTRALKSQSVCFLSCFFKLTTFKFLGRKREKKGDKKCHLEVYRKTCYSSRHTIVIPDDGVNSCLI